MATFEKFMKQNKAKKEDIQYAVTKSIKDENGEPLMWTLRHIPAADVNKIKEKFTYEEQIPGKYGQYREKIKDNEYLTALICESVVVPDLRNSELQDSYGVMTPEALLYALVDDYGEFLDLQIKISEMMGLNDDVNTKAAEAKNS
jgi:hypothetical protein